MKGLVEKCNLNIDRIFQNATAKLGDRIHKPGVVSPRLLKHVVDDGKFCEDELAAEYYGGILAASRGDVSRDDRGIAFLAVVKALSVYQLRMHYALYTLWLRHFHGAGLNTGDSNDLEKMRLYLPWPVYQAAMQFGDGEDAGQILPHSLHGLRKHGLVDDFAYARQEFLKGLYSGAPGPGIVVDPTFFGCEMYLWALGVPERNGHDFLKLDPAGVPQPLAIPDGSQPTTPIKTA